MPHHLPSFRNATAIKLVIGPEAVVFVAHREFLCGLTDFFRGATAYTFKETAANQISMPEDDPDTVDRFLQWVYTRTYHLSATQTPETNYLELILLYKLADKLQINALRNDLIRSLYDLKARRITPDFDDLVEASRTLPASCSFLKLLLAHWIWHPNLSWFQSPSSLDRLLAAPELSAELVIRFAQRVQNQWLVNPFDQSMESHFIKEVPSFQGKKVTQVLQI